MNDVVQFSTKLTKHMSGLECFYEMSGAFQRVVRWSRVHIDMCISMYLKDSKNKKMAIAEIQSCTTRKTCPTKNHKMLTNLGMQPTKVWEFKNQGN